MNRNTRGRIVSKCIGASVAHMEYLLRFFRERVVETVVKVFL